MADWLGKLVSRSLRYWNRAMVSVDVQYEKEHASCRTYSNVG